jgi:hypothetical protein
MSAKKDAVVAVDENDPDVFINKAIAPITENEEVSFEDLIRIAEEGSGVIEFVGSIWEVCDKSLLIDEPFMIYDVRHYEGKFGPAVAVMLVSKEQLKGSNGPQDHFVINDGSTGLYQQVIGMVKRSGKKSGILCPRGLRASTYDYDITDGFGERITGEATTYYVA